MKRIYYLYKLEAPNGKVYIGQTISVNKRFGAYRNGCSESQALISNAIKKYGWDNFKKSIIFDGYKSQFEIDQLEYFEIKKYTDLGISLNIRKHVHSPIYSKGELHRKSRPVLQISLDFEVLNEYVSGTEASLVMGVAQTSISYACRSENPFCFGFYWRFKDELNIDYLKSITNLAHPNSIEIVQMNYKNESIRIWESQAKASTELNINQANIFRVLIGKGLSAGGFRWCYRKDFDKGIIPEYNFKKRGKPILIYNLKKELLHKFETITEASKALKIDRSNIMRQLNCKIKNPKKYIYEYE